MALDLGLDLVDRLLEVGGGRLADGCPFGVGGAEGGCEGVGFSLCGAAVSAAGVGVGGLALGGIEPGAELAAGPSVVAFGGVLNRPGFDGGSGYWIPTPVGAVCWAA